MIPPIWEIWGCVFNAMNLMNMHPSRIDTYLPEEDEPGLIGLESVHELLESQQGVPSDTQLKKAS